MFEFLSVLLGISTLVLIFIVLRNRDQLARKESQLQAQQQLLTNLRESLTDREEELVHVKRDQEQLALDMDRSCLVLNALQTINFDPAFVLDEDHHIIASNQMAEQLVGEQAVGESLFQLIDAPELYDIVNSSTEEPIEAQLDWGSVKYRARAQQIKHGDEVYVAVVMQDISKLVRISRARRDMVANISHELATPIANIRLIIDSLFHEADKPKRKASIQSLVAIADQTDSLQYLVQELLDLSMIESGQAIMRLVETKLHNVVSEAIKRVEDQLEPKELELEIDVPKTLKVLCDEGQLRRVIVNLLHNAIKWSPKEGVISVSATTQNEMVLVDVVDSGPGIPEDQVDRIFERFYQVDGSRSGRGGSGLGLAICKHIVEAHGGTIWATGNSGDQDGGHFVFTLLNADLPESPPEDEPVAELTGY